MLQTHCTRHFTLKVFQSIPHILVVMTTFVEREKIRTLDKSYLKLTRIYKGVPVEAGIGIMHIHEHKYGSWFAMRLHMFMTNNWDSLSLFRLDGNLGSYNLDTFI